MTARGRSRPWLRRIPGLAAVLALAACTGNRVETVAGCYEPTIGPYAGPLGGPDPRFRPAWVELKPPREGSAISNEVGLPPGFEFPVITVGEWLPLGRDSVLVQWGSQHLGAAYRLAVRRGELRGFGAPGGGQIGGRTWPVVARRVPCQ